MPSRHFSAELQNPKTSGEISNTLDDNYVWILLDHTHMYMYDLTCTLYFGPLMHTNLAAPDIAPVSTTDLLLVADKSAEELSLLVSVGTRLLYGAPPTATAHQSALCAGRTLTKVIHRFTCVDDI